MQFLKETFSIIIYSSKNSIISKHGQLLPIFFLQWLNDQREKSIFINDGIVILNILSAKLIIFGAKLFFFKSKMASFLMHQKKSNLMLLKILIKKFEYIWTNILSNQNDIIKYEYRCVC